MSKFLILLSILAGICLVSCNTGKVASDSGDLKKRSAKFLTNKLKKNQINYDWFSAKSKVRYEDPNQSISFIAYVRIKKDSIIWLSLKKIGMQAARVRITPEKFEVAVYIPGNQGYVSEPYSALKDNFNIDLSFSDLQELLVGNPILMEERKFNSKTEEGRYVLYHREEDLDIELYLNGKDYSIEKVEGEMGKNILEAKFKDYKDVDKRKIAHSKFLEIEGGEIGLIEIDMQLSKVEINVPKKTKYTVPSSYEEIKIFGN